MYLRYRAVNPESRVTVLHPSRSQLAVNTLRFWQERQVSSTRKRLEDRRREGWQLVEPFFLKATPPTRASWSVWICQKMKIGSSEQVGFGH